MAQFTNFISNHSGSLSLLVSVAGFAIAIWQIVKTRNAADAALQAAIEARKAIHKNFMLADISSCTGIIEEVKIHVRNRTNDAALLRVTDLSGRLTQLRHLPDSSSEEYSIAFQDMLTHIAVIRDDLEQKSALPDYAFDIVKVNEKLAEISDYLNALIGKSKYSC